MIKIIDINCDMGEAFGHWKISEVNDKQIMPYISSANVATGFHAGDPNHINKLVQLAIKHQVAVGAHIGYRDLQGFGRRKINATTKELINDMVYQIGAIREFCTLHGITLNHIKPHGSLYMEMAVNAELSTAFIEVLQKTDKNTPVYCMPNSETYKAAKQKEYPVVREFYADRNYADNGSIIFTRHASANNAELIKQKVLKACIEKKVKTISGKIISIEFESVCFHSDTPGCLDIASKIKEGLCNNNIKIATYKP
ncbi:MAG: 5-oxoprolinase subunit PxpA [Tenacibaculum sp.]